MRSVDVESDSDETPMKINKNIYWGSSIMIGSKKKSKLNSGYTIAE